MNYLDGLELENFGGKAAGRVRSASGKFYKKRSPQGRAIVSARKARK